MHWSIVRTTGLIGLLLVGGAALSGCAQEQHLSSDYGVALRQDMAAQIADPDAHYTGTPAPGSDPSRVALAQDRYKTGKVIPPASTATTLDIAAGSSGGSSAAASQ